MTNIDLPTTTTLALSLEAGRLHVTLNRPEARNAMSFAMVSELEAVFDAVRERRDVRIIVLRGAGGNFCAGGDVKDMANARTAAPGSDGRDPLALANLQFGKMLRKIDTAPQAVVAVLEGAVMGGGFGLACVADVAIAVEGVSFKLPETSLGLPPAQIAPFIVRRIGLTQARRLAVTGGKIFVGEALGLGLVHDIADDDAQLQDKLAYYLGQIERCAPGAIAATKKIVLAVGETPMDTLLDAAADDFAACARGAEGVEGMMAFIQKRKPTWDVGGGDGA
jgi:isohexenylglutaconyl-CoA hydratase